MKNALILHGWQGHSQENWFPWLKKELENEGYKVWVPDLPDSQEPNMEKWCNHILNNPEWELNEESIIIGHSSGAVAVLGLLERLSEKNITIHHAICVAAFKDSLKEKALEGLFEQELDFPKIRKAADKITFIHSTDDPYCPMEHASYLAVKTGGKLIIQHGEKHFSTATDPKFTEFPFLLELILKR